MSSSEGAFPIACGLALSTRNSSWRRSLSRTAHTPISPDSPAVEFDVSQSSCEAALAPGGHVSGYQTTVAINSLATRVLAPRLTIHVSVKPLSLLRRAGLGSFLPTGASDLML
jgi:hypothetical protein